MNNLQEKQLAKNKRDALELDRAFTELKDFGWKIKGDPLSGYKKHLENLEKIESDLQQAPPDDTRELVIEELAALASVDAAIREAQERLKIEELGFLKNRDTFVNPLDDEVKRTDKVLQDSLMQVYKALQARWVAMNQKAQVWRVLHFITEKYNDTDVKIAPPTIRLPKPFSKQDLGNWRAFIHVFFERATERIAHSESQAPADVVRVIYEGE